MCLSIHHLCMSSIKFKFECKIDETYGGFSQIPLYLILLPVLWCSFYKIQISGHASPRVYPNKGIVGRSDLEGLYMRIIYQLLMNLYIEKKKKTIFHYPKEVHNFQIKCIHLLQMVNSWIFQQKQLYLLFASGIVISDPSTEYPSSFHENTDTITPRLQGRDTDVYVRLWTW